MRKTQKAKEIEQKRMLGKKSSGYAKYAKNHYQLLRDKSLSPSEFILFSLILNVLVDWDPRHVEHFGSYDLTNSEVAPFLGVYPSTIYRSEKSLIKKGYVYVRSDGRKALKGFGLYLKQVDVSRGGRVGIVDMHVLISNSFVNNVCTKEFNSELQDFINYEWADYQGIQTIEKYISHIGTFNGVYKAGSEDVDPDEVIRALEKEGEL